MHAHLYSSNPPNSVHGNIIITPRNNPNTIIKYNQSNITIKLFPVYRRITAHDAGNKSCYAVEKHAVFSAIHRRSNDDISYLLNISIYLKNDIIVIILIT